MISLFSIEAYAGKCVTAELVEYTSPTITQIWPGEAIDARTLEQEWFMVALGSQLFLTDV